MSLKDRLQQHRGDEQTKREDIERRIRDEWDRRFVATRRIVNGLQIEDKLREVRDEIWGEGEIVHTEDSQTSRVFFVLSASWPVYKKAERRQVNMPYNEMDLVYFPATVENETSKMRVEVEAFMDDKGNWNNISVWDYRSVSVNVFTDDSIYSEPTMRMVLNSDEPIKKTDQERIDDLLVEACDRISSQYPLSIRRLADRQEIIDRVLSGDLERSEIPADFGYQFPPKPRPVVLPPAKTPSKIKKWLGF